ncbi:carcinoembryonic antigen-related cell adhesion molecule 5-like isoform X2 [Otolemur garnettii]|uniref:carcinoembryonic antigen-related cell adhesion molecule 5-like isoform X2 n=1 Tax=Otolemur garnettii TaxID=30611 RepID=UPI000C7F011D|nr:carcinoembryonic antigen-related cell adhesion molecule 5-like isoform X2 [Otolemur garnettii]
MEDKDSVSLTCEPETPDTTYVWWIKGQSLQISDRVVMSQDNRTLTLFNITRNDIGPYECGNWNPVSANRSDPFTLNVLYGPDVPTISPPESYYRPGANLTLSCHSDSNPPAQYSWFIDGRPQQATQELFIASVTVNNSGSYACVAQNSATGRNGTTVKTITVSVELPRPSITSNNSNPVENKDSVALTCEPAAQDVTYLWWLNNQNLPISPRLQLSPDNRTLTLFDVTRDDSGHFVCEIQTPESTNHSDPFTLNVLYGPDAPTISPPEASYSSGANLSLSCHSDSNPPAQYSWLINGSSQQATQELFIPRITAKDSGSYTCHAHNSATGLNRTSVMKIIVSDAPVKESSPGLSMGAVVGIVIGVLAGVALMAALAYFLSSTSRRASDQHDLTEHKSSASNHSEDHSDILPDNINEIFYSSLNFKAQKPTEPNSASPSPTATETVYSEVKKK